VRQGSLPGRSRLEQSCHFLQLLALRQARLAVGLRIGRRFNKKNIHHLFCSTCGIESFARGKRPSDGADMVAINTRCLDGVDPDTLTVKKVDGRNF
jgi:hypothetical protein